MERASSAAELRKPVASLGQAFGREQPFEFPHRKILGIFGCHACPALHTIDAQSALTPGVHGLCLRFLGRIEMLVRWGAGSPSQWAGLGTSSRPGGANRARAWATG